MPWSEIIDILQPLYMRFCFSDLNLIFRRWLRNSFETLFRIVKLKKLHTYLSYNLNILISRPIYNKNIEMHRIICPWSQSREGFWIWKKQRKSWRQNYFPVCHQRINCCRWRFESRNQKTFRNRLWLDTFLLWRSYKEIRYVAIFMQCSLRFPTSLNT